MAEVFLIRHGQASFGQLNYDALSDLGHKQTKICGGYLFEHVFKPDDKIQFVSGALTRQRETMENILSNNSHRYDYSVMDNFNEFDHDNVLEVAFKHYGSREAFMQEVAKQPDPKKYFHKLYVKAVDQWMNNPDDTSYNERFSEFNNRVETGFKQLLAACESGGKIVLTSSAGPISLCLQQSLGLNGQSAFALNDVMSNASITRLIFNENKISLSYFNASQYLTSAGCPVSFR